MTPHAVLFDCVGTLLRPKPDVAVVYASAGKAFGSQRTEQEIRQRFATVYRAAFAPHQPESLRSNHKREQARWQQVVAELFDDLADTGDLFLELWNHFAKASSWQLYPDAPAAWHKALKRGQLVGIASNFDDRLPQLLAGFELFVDCELLFYSTGIGYDKPHMQFFRAIETRLQLAPAEILLVGDDNQCDYEGALQAGWQAVHLDRSGAATGSHVIHTLNQL